MEADLGHNSKAIFSASLFAQCSLVLLVALLTYACYLLSPPFLSLSYNVPLAFMHGGEEFKNEGPDWFQGVLEQDSGCG